MNIAILGASKGMGRAMARQLAERGDRLALLGRDLDELQRSVGDLQVRSDSKEHYAFHCDLEQPEGFAEALRQAKDALGSLDAVVVTAALFGTQEALEEDVEQTRRLLTVNLANTVAFCEHARKQLMEQGGGTLCVFSSVAGDRGRKPVGIYGASKAGLSHYLESLDHKYRRQGLKTICIKPGFIKTSMTEGLKPPPFAGEPEQAARDAIRALDRGKPVVYTPWIWGWILLIIRWLPRFVMRRINF